MRINMNVKDVARQRTSDLVNLLSELITVSIGNDLPCDRTVPSCIRVMKVDWGHAMTQRQEDGCCPACLAYYHMSAARNAVMAFKRTHE
jgi:hypothetical protein